MDKTTAGWTTFISALGAMCLLLTADVAKLSSWSVAFQPPFVAVVLAHIGTVILGFAGGKMIPTKRQPGMQTRSTDKPTV